MGAITEINGENIRIEKLDEEAQRILDFLKINKNSYAFNRAILKYALQKLENDMSTTIFQ